jgi:hypothetical protein
MSPARSTPSGMGLEAAQRSGGERDGNKGGNALRKCAIRRTTPRPGRGRGPRFDPWSAYHENAELQSEFLAEPLDDTEHARTVGATVA